MNCRVCGSELPEGAMFCGECGSSVTATRVRRPAVEDPRPSDTTIIAPLPRPAVAGPKSTVHSVPVPVPAPRSSFESPEVVQGQPGEPAQPAEDGSRDASGSLLPEGPSVTFMLSASTGERIIVAGSGLLGRRPIAQPGETPDQLVSVADTGRSVSKTHLEFGIEAGELWICDRYSANGTVIAPGDGVPRPCEPGRRYRVERGARIEIGDQYLDVG